MQKKEPVGSFFYLRRARGFTVPELVAVIVIASILAAVALPRMWASGYDDTRFYDETLAALRYAQRTATAYQRNVCVTFSGGNQLALTYASNYGTSEACGPTLPPPGGTGTSYVVTAPGSTSYTSASSFVFDRLGRPFVAPFVASATQTVTLSGGQTITVQGETGYVH